MVITVKPSPICLRKNPFPVGIIWKQAISHPEAGGAAHSTSEQQLGCHNYFQNRSPKAKKFNSSTNFSSCKEVAVLFLLWCNRAIKPSAKCFYLKVGNGSLFAPWWPLERKQL